MVVPRLGTSVLLIGYLFNDKRYKDSKRTLAQMSIIESQSSKAGVDRTRFQFWPVQDG